jgi:16S rRNA (guanine527-N7)-methyltransferase
MPEPKAPLAPDVSARLEALAVRYALPTGAAARLGALLELVAAEPSAITSVRDPAAGVEVHVADSLAGLDVAALRGAATIADLGAGAGFPGLVLAIARPDARVTLVESVARKCAFLRRAAADLDLRHVEVAQVRAEAWPAGLGAHEAVTARALAALPVLLEYAAPLLRPGGTLVAWKATVDAQEARDGAAAAATLGMGPLDVRPVAPYPGSRDRALYLSSKVRPTPPQYPRRPGMARKRPLRAST